MFKRVEKRRLKKEEEEELGLDEDMKEILGMHDTDSEESASDSDNSDGSDEEGEGLGSEQEGLEGGGDSAAEDSEEGDENGDGEDEDPNVTVSQALTDPIYVVSVQPEVKACIVCPGKLLKGAKMVQLHRISKAHERRLRQFKALATNAEPDGSAWEILQRSAEEKPKLSLAPSENATSKRAEKKRMREAALEHQREQAKVKRAREAEKKKRAALIAAAVVVVTAAATAAIAIAEGSDFEFGSDSEDASSEASIKATPTLGSKRLSNEQKVKADSTSNPPKIASPPKKKRKVEQEIKREATTTSPQTTSIPNASSSANHPRKPKQKKAGGAAADAAPSTNSPMKAAPPTERKDSVKTIAKSISDRTKSARERALTASKGSITPKRPKRKVVASKS